MCWLMPAKNRQAILRWATGVLRCAATHRADSTVAWPRRLVQSQGPNGWSGVVVPGFFRSTFERYRCSLGPRFSIVVTFWKNAIPFLLKQNPTIQMIPCIGPTLVVQISKKRDCNKLSGPGTVVPWHHQSMRWVNIWLVLWNMAFIFPYIGNSNPNWLSYFSEG